MNIDKEHEEALEKARESLVAAQRSRDMHYTTTATGELDVSIGRGWIAYAEALSHKEYNDFMREAFDHPFPCLLYTSPSPRDS